MSNDSNRTNTSTTGTSQGKDSGTAKQGFGNQQGSRNTSSPKADEIARDIGRHADDGVRTNTPEQDGAKQAPSRNSR